MALSAKSYNALIQNLDESQEDDEELSADLDDLIADLDADNL